MALEVIGAGFGRTGTLSLKAALEQLGFERCHHMLEVVGRDDQLPLWADIAARDPARGYDDVDWARVFDGYRASCDWPSCNFYAELARRFPDAKVVLSVRDADRWYDSVAGTIRAHSVLGARSHLMLYPRMRRFYRMVDRIVWQGSFHGRFDERAYAIECFHEHVQRVKETIPPERLLVFEAADGWEPLCAFLGVPVPDGSYPHLNDGAAMKRGVAQLRRRRAQIFAAGGAGVALLVAAAYGLLG